MYYLKLRILFEWLIFRLNSLNLEIILLIDWISLLFISVIFLISSIIILYRYEYMRGGNYIERFVYLVFLFILSIILIILSPNILGILFGWDGLGIISYCLVIFYQNYMSYNSGMVTVLCNRIGDVGLLLRLGLVIILGRWNYWNVGHFKLGIFILLLASITKRAQMPFSVWLPMAIAAPTPVSALVHSSTLVTAGVYLIIRFNKFLIISNLNIFLFFISILTIFIAGLIASIENDLKKIIALSTLSQLGLIIIILSIGQRIIAFYHLLTHAIFKSLLFICAGVIIHSIFNNQDIRGIGNLNELIPFTIIRFYLSRLALCGFPFLAGFYSKDYIIEIMYRNQINRVLQGLVVVSLGFTVIYSIRLFYYLFYNKIKFFSRYFNVTEIYFINFSMIILIVFRVIVGSILNWIFFFDYYFIYINLLIKLVTLRACIIGIFLRGIIIFNKGRFYYLSYYLGRMWYLTYIYLWVYRPIIVIGGSMAREVDKTWVEYSFGYLLTYFIKNFKVGFSYKIFIFINFIIFILLFRIMLI